MCQSRSGSSPHTVHSITHMLLARVERKAKCTSTFYRGVVMSGSEEIAGCTSCSLRRTDSIQHSWTGSRTTCLMGCWLLWFQPLQATRTVLSTDGGYLSIGRNQIFWVMYIGSPASKDQNWVYGTSGASKEKGWLPLDATDEILI